MENKPSISGKEGTISRPSTSSKEENISRPSTSGKQEKNSRVRQREEASIAKFLERQSRARPACVDEGYHKRGMSSPKIEPTCSNVKWNKREIHSFHKFRDRHRPTSPPIASYSQAKSLDFHMSPKMRSKSPLSRRFRSAPGSFVDVENLRQREERSIKKSASRISCMSSPGGKSRVGSPSECTFSSGVGQVKSLINTRPKTRRAPTPPQSSRITPVSCAELRLQITQERERECLRRREQDSINKFLSRMSCSSPGGKDRQGSRKTRSPGPDRKK